MGRPISGGCAGLKVVILLKVSTAFRPDQVRTQRRANGVSGRVIFNVVWDIVVAFGCDVLDYTAVESSFSEVH